MLLHPDTPEDPECADFTMRENAQYVWITVRNLSVYIRQADEGVSVDIYPLHREVEDSIAGTWALYTDGNTQENQ